MKCKGQGILLAPGNYVSCGQETKHIRKICLLGGKEIQQN